MAAYKKAALDAVKNPYQVTKWFKSRVVFLHGICQNENNMIIL
jgi:hypothetical protein